jgi:hypothetical protein
MSSDQLEQMSKGQILRTIGLNYLEKVDICNIEGKLHAVKKFFLLKATKIEDKKLELLEEKKREYELIQKGLQNVVKCDGSFYDQREEIYQYSMECFDQNLKEHLKSHGSPNLKTLLFLMSGMIKGNSFFE